MARRKRYSKGGSRDAGGFVALPWSVLDSPAYLRLSHPAKALLLEVARQYHGDDNGRMLLTRKHLAARGWRSEDVVSRAKHELLEAGFIFETCKGGRPARASWYAATWLTLDVHPGFDPGAAAAFPRGAYRETGTGGDGFSRGTPGDGATNAPKSPRTAPGDGARNGALTPGDGAVEAYHAPGNGATILRGHPEPAQNREGRVSGMMGTRRVAKPDRPETRMNAGYLVAGVAAAIEPKAV